ncbi:PAS domain-containing protein [Sphingomonas sp. JC676]|uniref:PAS domain-containing protein n=1 Tax=Sphingomonas sp. JC676 TaxID=2768065 RepID=UPI0016585743|nr:PAS domain-containing protein [Sphingomonas sp. JC676]MBC9033355.1 PAS domain-containing protein [Sphingomonas sp. JC676]
MSGRIRDFGWRGHPLGTPETWPGPLKFALDMALASSFPTAIYWGPELRLLYNDAWSAIPADRHPWALGRAGAEVWADIWDTVGPQIEKVVRDGEGFVAYDQMLPMERDGRPQETWWNYSFTPIRDETGRVLGVLNQGNETTRLVLAERARSAEIERLRDYFQQAPGAIALLHGPNHVFEIANSEYLDLIGGRDVIGKTAAEALPEVVEQGFIDLLDQVYRSGETFRASGMPVLLHRTPGADPETRLLDFVYHPIKDTNRNSTDIFVAASDVTETAAAAEALRRSEERLQLALNASIGIGTWDWNAATGRITGDARFAKLFGIEPARVSGGGSFEAVLPFIHPEDRESLGAAVQHAVAARTPLSIEIRVVRPDGEIRWLLTQGQCIYNDAGKPVRFPGVSFDITERKASEEAARTAAEDLHEAIEAQSFLHELADRLRALDTPDAIMRETAHALGERMALDRVGFYRVLSEDSIQFGPAWTSARLSVLEGTMSMEAVGPNADIYRSGRTTVMRDTAREKPGSMAARVAPSGVGVPLLRGGAWVAVFFANYADPHDWAAEEIAFIEAVAEISWDAVERTGAIVALRESEAKFRAIANSIDQMVWSTRPDGFHDYYNDRWYEYTGVPHGSTDGEAWNDMFHPDDQARAWSLWRHSLATGDFYRIEYRLRHRSGQYRWVLGSAQPVRDESGTITRWFGTCTDIQDIIDAREVLARSRGELEAEIATRTARLMAAEEQLRQAQKMEAVGQLTGGIAHDFNNMLAVVIGALDLLERRLARGQTDVDRYVTAARDGATRAAALTQRLLAFSRQQPLAPAPIDANEMVGGMIDLLVRTLGEGVSVETHLPARLWRAMADRNQLENVILNLAVNGRDAMPEGGRLTIETGNVAVTADEAERYEIAPGDYVEIAVADTGSGMPPDVAARAFDPFFTTKGVGKGTGLGLSQVFGFVRQSGGHVRIETAPGTGTRVCIWLPADHAADLGTPENDPDRDVSGAQPGEVVMVVEDEERVRAFSVEALRELGYAVVDARDGLEALQMIERGQPVSLLFTDVVMPEMSGRDLAEQARQRLPELKVLLTSGYAPEVAGGADESILSKPFDIDQLAERVRAALDG